MSLDSRSTRTRTPAPKPDATWDLVLKRNPVERLKQEKAPLGIRDELPALIAAGYENVPEEDMVRLQWWGLYHDKPKIGTFMLRIKLPSGYLTPAKLRAIGETSNRFGRGDGELATRQNIQLHWLELGRLPEVFSHLDAAGITTAGGCGDTVRNITGCPVQGLDPNELFDCSPIVDEAAGFFYGNPDFCDLPRKHKYTERRRSVSSFCAVTASRLWKRQTASSCDCRYCARSPASRPRFGTPASALMWQRSAAAAKRTPSGMFARADSGLAHNEPVASVHRFR